MDTQRPDSGGDSRGGVSRGTWVLIGFAAVAAYLLLSEHRAHAIAYLPYGLLLACLVMHFFHGHGDHGRHHGGGRGGSPDESRRSHGSPDEADGR